MLAGFSHTDITPPIGTHKVGWLKVIVPDHVADPLAARIAIFDDGTTRIAFIQLDTLSIRWSDTDDIRRRIAERHAFPPASILVAATHNHGGPAIANIGNVKRDDAYVASLKQKVVDAFGAALDARQEVELGFASVAEYRLSHNRRIVQRDGITRTHGDLFSPDALCVEGPIDPEVAVLAARRPDTGQLVGAIVNFACHPVHHGGDNAFSSGYPGVLCRALIDSGMQGALFLNGACGNIAHGNRILNQPLEHDAMGSQLAEDAMRAIADMTWSTDWPLTAASTRVDLPYRNADDDEIAGTLRGAQRFIDSAIYDRGMPTLLERIRSRGTQPAEVQMLGLGNLRFVAIPSEYFVEFGLRIKEEAWPRRALVVSHANGMVGYLPTAAAFTRGGYETTFTGSSRQAPESGDLLADAAIQLARQ